MHRLVALLALVAGIFTPLSQAQAESAEVITGKSVQAIEDLRGYAPGIDKLLREAEGVLVFPDIVELTFGVGGQFGEGVLLVKDQPVAYYATAGARYGLEGEDRRKAEVILFMTLEALQAFRGSIGWEVGIDGEVAMMDAPPPGKKIDAREVRDPVLAFVFSEQGLAEELDLEGGKVTRIAR